MAYDVRVRDALNKQGVNNDQIAFNNGNVMVDGQNFMKPQKNFQGTTFTDQSSFDQAWSQYKMPKANAVNGQVVQQGQGPAATQVNPPNQQIGQGVQTNAPSMQGGMPQGNPQDQYMQMISQVYDRIMNPQSYDVYNSPEYAAQEARAQRGSDQAIRAAQEALGSAGFGRSTVLGERSQGIANDQNDFMMTQVAPQLIAQKRAQEQQQTQNLGNIINYLMSADQANMQRAGLTGEYQGEQTLPGQLQQEQIEGAQLGNQESKLMLENLPEEIELNMQKLRNDAKQSDFDLQKAEYEVDQMLDPNSMQNQYAKLELSTAKLNNDIAQLEKESLPEMQRAELQRIKAQTNASNRANKQTDEEIKRERLRNELLQEQVDQLKSSGEDREGQLNREQEEFELNRDLKILKETGQAPEGLAKFGVDVEALEDPAVKEDLNALYEAFASEEIQPKDALKIIEDKVNIGAEDPENGEKLKQAIYKLYPELNPTATGEESNEKGNTFIQGFKKLFKFYDRDKYTIDAEGRKVPIE